MQLRETSHLNKHKEVVLFHLHIGHISLFYSYLMSSEDVPKHMACACDLTVEHILTECGDYMKVGQWYDDVENVAQHCQHVSVNRSS